MSNTVNNGNISNVTQNSAVREGGLASINSVQMMFALMQMELSKEHKDNAKSLIENVKTNQAMSKKYAETIAKLNALKKEDFDCKLPTDMKQLEKDIETCQKASDNYDKMLKEIADGTLKPFKHGKDDCYKLPDALMKDLQSMANRVGKKRFENLTRGDDNIHMKYELEAGKKEVQSYMNLLKTLKETKELGFDTTSLTSGKVDDATLKRAVSSLQGLQEEFGTKNQTLMVQIQDMLGQYNANLQGANSAVQQSNNVLQSLAKGG